MRFLLTLPTLICSLGAALPTEQLPLLRHAHTNRTVSAALFSELEELARIVDISYCVGLAGIGISKPFRCLSRCSDFPAFELVKVSPISAVRSTGYWTLTVPDLEHRPATFGLVRLHRC